MTGEAVQVPMEVAQDLRQWAERLSIIENWTPNSHGARTLGIYKVLLNTAQSGSSSEPCDPDCSWTGVDSDPVDDPLKLWRCDGCGATGTNDELSKPAAHFGSQGGSDAAT